DAVGVSCTGGVAAAVGGAAAGTAAKGAGAAATAWAGSATGRAATGAGAARETGRAALIGRATLAVRWVVADLLNRVGVAAGSTLDANGSLTTADGSLTIGVAEALPVAGAAGAWVTGAAGARLTGWAGSGATWASKAVEERARTAAIAVIAGRIFAFLWVILRATNAEPLWVHVFGRR